MSFSFILIAVVAIVFPLVSFADIGVCEKKAQSLLESVSAKQEQLRARDSGGTVRSIKSERISIETIDAGDSYFERYLMQVYYWNPRTKNWKTFTGQPTQIVYSYSEKSESPDESFCELSFFSFAGYNWDSYSKLGQ